MPAHRRFAVVTGASEGLGAALAGRLGDSGYDVALVARSRERLEQQADSFRARGISASVHCCDLSQREQLLETYARILRDHERVDLLCNNAGVGRFGPFLDTRVEDVVAPIDVPLAAAMLGARLFVPGMVASGRGSIVNIVSAAAYFELPQMVAYTTARCALLAFSRALGEELRGTGVRVKAVCPAWVNTRYVERNDSDAGWLPRVARWFPRHDAEHVAARIVEGLDSGAGEQLLSARLAAFAWSYRHFPRLSRGTLKLAGLYQPTAGRGSDA